MKKQKQTKSHPIHDIWILARAKLRDGKKYYGAYPAGFPERARIVLGAGLQTPLLHVCGGMARYYAYPNGFGPYDKTLDLDPATEPDFLQDARKPWPMIEHDPPLVYAKWRAVLIDPPYSELDADKYRVGRSVLPTPAELLHRAVEVTDKGARVGILHYQWARPVAGLRQIGIYTVLTGCGNKARCFTVFERMEVEQ
mgnify:FL=1